MTNCQFLVERFSPADLRTLDHQDAVGYVQSVAGDLDVPIKTWRAGHAIALEHLGADHKITRLLDERAALKSASGASYPAEWLEPR